MPVTAKLSRNFYEKLGDDVAAELVEWFNAVDATYRTDLRELNELNFARFDAKVGQRFAELHSEMDRRFAEADVRMERRFAEADVRMERRFAEAEAKAALDRRFAESRAETDRGIAALRVEFRDLRNQLVAWMIGLWIPLALAVIGLYLKR